MQYLGVISNTAASGQANIAVQLKEAEEAEATTANNNTAASRITELADSAVLLF